MRAPACPCDRERKASVGVQGLPSWRAGPGGKGSPSPSAPTCRRSLPTLGLPTGLRQKGLIGNLQHCPCGPHEPLACAELGGQHVHPGARRTGIFKSPIAQVSTFSSYKCREEKKKGRERRKSKKEKKGPPCRWLILEQGKRRWSKLIPGEPRDGPSTPRRIQLFESAHVVNANSPLVIKQFRVFFSL